MRHPPTLTLLIEVLPLLRLQTLPYPPMATCAPSIWSCLPRPQKIAFGEKPLLKCPVLTVRTSYLPNLSLVLLRPRRLLSRSLARLRLSHL